MNLSTVIDYWSEKQTSYSHIFLSVPKKEILYSALDTLLTFYV